eukprot:66160_1
MTDDTTLWSNIASCNGWDATVALSGDICNEWANHPSNGITSIAANTGYSIYFTKYVSTLGYDNVRILYDVYPESLEEKEDDFCYVKYSNDAGSSWITAATYDDQDKDSTHSDTINCNNAADNNANFRVKFEAVNNNYATDKKDDWCSWRNMKILADFIPTPFPTSSPTDATPSPLPSPTHNPSKSPTIITVLPSKYPSQSPNSKAWQCGDILREDYEQLAVPVGWFICYITAELDPNYVGNLCSQLLVNVCGGFDSAGLLAAGGNYGCWHGNILSGEEASDATNNVVSRSCVDNTQHTTKLNAWSGTDVLLGVCFDCPIVPTTPAPTSPTNIPTTFPSKTPTSLTNQPTITPTTSPTAISNQPSVTPTVSPTKYPSTSPTVTTITPTKYPTRTPTKLPSKTPSKSPTDNPSFSPTQTTVTPTHTPTYTPTAITTQPTTAPIVPTACPLVSATSTLPPQSSSYSGNVRGYWFQAPVDFAFTGILIPTTASTGSMTAAIVRFNNGPPPQYATTTNDFVQLDYWKQVSTIPINCIC